MVKLYVTDISPFMDGTLYSAAYAISTKERKKKADRCRCYPDKVRSIVAGLLLEYAYKHYSKDSNDLKENPSLVEVTGESLLDFHKVPSAKKNYMPREREGENGKPYFEGEDVPFFNLSHSGDRVVCIMADGEVGVDIQKMSGVRESVVRKCFLPGEIESLKESVERDRVFTEIWCRKEAVVKLTGEGLAQILKKEFCDKTVLFSEWFEDDYVIAWAVYSKEEPVPHCYEIPADDRVGG